MGHTSQRALGRVARHRRLRKKLVGLPQRPRLCVFRSHQHLYAQLVDDLAGRTLLACSTRDERLKKKLAKTGDVPAATALGVLLATEATKQGIKEIVFDRGGYLYHGRVKALAEALRAGGLAV